MAVKSSAPFVVAAGCILLIVLSLFLGHGWQEPLSLLAPQNSIILQLRMERMLAGIIVGASLAVAGCILQAVLKNPLAEPYVLGISAGSGLAIAASIVMGYLALSHITIAGFAGAMISLWAVYSLARTGRITSQATLVLAGVIWGSFCGSALMFITSISSADRLHTLVWWFLGDLQIYDTDLAHKIFVFNGIILGSVLFLGQRLNVLILGHEMTGHLGLNPEKWTWIFLGLASCLTASSVCVSGMIGFVGLIAPHIARILVGADHRKLLPLAALIGATLLPLADGLGRMLLYPAEIPVGVFTSLLGAPFFFYLLKTRRHELWL